MNVLIVEDDIATQEILRMFLCDELKLECSHVYDTKQAIHHLEHTCPDVIILDLLLKSEIATPILQFVKKIRCKPRIIVMSALRDASKYVENFDVFALLPKPFDIEHLKTLLFKK